MLFWRNRHEVRDEELNAFVDGELEESARRRVERHIESCAPCTDAVTELRAVSRAMSELPAVRAPRSFALREADVSPAPASGGTGLFGSVTPLLSGVAAIAIVAFVVLVGVDITGNRARDFDAGTGGRLSMEADGEASLLPEGEGGDSFAAYGAGEEEPATDGAAAPGDANVPDDDGDLLEGDSDNASVGDIDDPAAPELAAPPEEIAEEPQSRELTQGFDGNRIAPALADDDEDRTGLRVAESIAAAIAIAAGGVVLLIWWRRRATAG